MERSNPREGKRRMEETESMNDIYICEFENNATGCCCRLLSNIFSLIGYFLCVELWWEVDMVGGGAAT
jgi:hypothetical protein